jgi:predicted class III extradiol MEMO1 family dioxygenase
MESTYLPRYHLYPTNPQILHHLVLELFVRTPAFAQEREQFVSLIPSGPIYKYGAVLAEHRKHIFHTHASYNTLVLIAFADLPPDIAGITTTDTQLHTFFGTIQVGKSTISGITNSAELFAMYAKPIEAQLPFIRAYKHLDNVVPYIINITKEQLVLEDVLDAIQSHHGDDACIVFVQPELGIEKILAYVEQE